MAEIIILGTGVGGLVTALTLAKDHEITLVDQAHTIGGRLQATEVEGFNFDIGATLLTPFFIDFLNHRLGVEIDVLDITWDIIATKERIPLRIDTSLTSIEDLFRITGKKWYTTLWSALLFLTHLHEFQTASIERFLEDIEVDPKLQLFLSTGAVDAGLPTNQAAAITLKLLEYAHHFKYPVGSTNQIPQRLWQKIQEHGGQLLLNHKVEKIQPKKKGVEVQTSEGLLEADYVVSAMGVPHTLNCIKAKSKQIKRARKLIKQTRPSIQTTHLLYAYEGDANTSYKGRAPLLNYYPVDTIDEVNSILVSAMNGQLSVNGCYVHFPALVDKTLVNNGAYPVSFWFVTPPSPSEADIQKMRNFVESEYIHFLPDFKEKARFLGYQSPSSFTPFYNDPGMTANIGPTIDFPVFEPKLTNRVYMSGASVEVKFAPSVIQASLSGYKVGKMLKNIIG
ncbi:MAG: NAD(P)/FAD-dependent oxidoreductase [Methanobacteriota archaeon]|nr:MAG: NAD(P)/FAD-dependent oxidoreductase [Euryarchaeota archaeon]